MSNYVSDTAAGKSVTAYIVLNKKGQHVATIRAHFSNAGVCLVNVHDDKAGFQYARAGGGGYDKFTHCLSGMTIDGHALSDHCARDGAPKPPKGRKTFPRGYKPKKGYSLANYGSVSKATGQRIHAYTFQDKAEKQLNYGTSRPEWNDSQWAECSTLAKKLESDWRESDDCESGYTDCYRESGLDYLKALGYRVIQAI